MAKQKAEEAPSRLVLEVNGKRYPLDLSDVTSMDAVVLRRQTGLSLRSLMVASQEDPDIDVIAALVWLSRRTQGERGLKFETVAEEITYDTEVETDEDAIEVEAIEAGEPPEA